MCDSRRSPSSNSPCFRSVGALAELFDIHCLPSYSFTTVTDWVYKAWEKAPADITTAEVIENLGILDPPVVLGQHYFIANPVALSPKWDFTSASEKGHPKAFVIGAKTGDIPAPSDPSTNIDWLSLKNAGGGLADQIFRVQTRGGQPPASVSGIVWLGCVGYALIIQPAVRPWVS